MTRVSRALVRAAEEEAEDLGLHPPKKARFAETSKQLLQVHFANVTQFGKSVQEWFWSRPADVHLFTETHLDEQRTEQQMQYFQVRGRNGYGHPAHSNENGGNHGGFLVLHMPHHLSHFLDAFTIDGCGWIAFVLSFQELQIAFFSIYFKCEEGLQGRTNSKLLARLLGVISNLQIAWCILGDWNCSPDEVSASVLLQKFQGTIFAPDESTLRGSVLDFAVVHNSLAGYAHLQTTWDVPFRPHCLLTLNLDLEVTAMKIQQIPRFCSMPKPTEHQRSWDSFICNFWKCEMYGEELNSLGFDLARWCSVTEQYLLQDVKHPKYGRGVLLSFEHQPLVQKQCGTIWKKGAPAFWCQLKQRFAYAKNLDDSKAIRGFQKAKDDVFKFWTGTEKCDYFLDLVHFWLQTRDEQAEHRLEHILEEQICLSQKAAAEQSALQYQVWIQAGQAKGLQLFYRSLKAGDLPWQRPFRDIPFADRMDKRLEQWGNLWHFSEEHVVYPGYDELVRKAQEQARSWPDITPANLEKVLRKLPRKACGADAITYDMLRHLPKEAIPHLASMLRLWEVKAQLPTQCLVNLIALLPKNSTQERPITLTSCLYRLWCRCRQEVLREWQHRLPEKMEYDKARPGSDVLTVALMRLVKSETSKALGRHHVTLLCDMSNFYDKIPLAKLPDAANALCYPPLPLLFALQVYGGKRILTAEGQASNPRHCTHGICAGCPQAPLLAKTHLAPALENFLRRHEEAHVDTWVDDISFDIEGSNAKQVAQEAVQAFRDLQNELADIELTMNVKKTGFVCSTALVEKHLKEKLQPHEPQPMQLMRDLGVDSQGARKRRIRQVQARFRRARARKAQLRKLRIPQARQKLRLYRGGIHPCAVWGVEAQGLAPRYRTELRVAFGRHLQWQRGGNLDIVFDLHSQKYRDPGDSVILGHMKAMWKILQSWPNEQISQLEKAWEKSLQILERARYDWLVIKGPLSALQGYLREWGWNLESFRLWHRAEGDGIPGNTIDPFWPWWKVEMSLLEEAKLQRFKRITKFTFCEDLSDFPDWSVAKKILSTLPEKKAHAVRTWMQGGIGKSKEDMEICQFCDEPADILHILWMCPATDAMCGSTVCQEWKRQIQNGERLALWARGISEQLHAEVDTGLDHLCRFGSLDIDQKLNLKAHDELTIGLMPTCGDVRIQHWTFAVVHHGALHGELERKGAITGYAPGQQTKQRALVLSLLLIADLVEKPCRVVIHDANVHKLWLQKRIDKLHPDLWDLFPCDNLHMVVPLYVNLKHVESPDGWSEQQIFRQRLKDAKATAGERAKLDAQPELQKILRERDTELKKVYEVAAERMSAVFQVQAEKQKDCPEVKGKNLRKAKKELLATFPGSDGDFQHRWRPARSGFKCADCSLHVNHRWKLHELNDARTAECPAMKVLEYNEEASSPERPSFESSSPIRETREQLIERILKNQSQDGVIEGQHCFEMTVGYLKCSKCLCREHRKAKRDRFMQFVESKCIQGKFEGHFDGHSTHVIEQHGSRLKCRQCKAACALNAARSAMPKALKQPCKKPESEDIRNVFMKNQSASQEDTEHEMTFVEYF